MRKLFKNLGVLQIFLSMLSVIAIMLASSYFVYQNSISGIFEKVSENNALAAKSLVQSFDNNFRTINNIIHSIHGLPPYDDLGTADEGRLDMSKVYTMVDNLSTLVSTAEFIEEVVVSYPGANLAITSKGTSSFTFFFDEQYKHEMYNASYWRTFAATKHAFKVFPEADFSVLTTAGQKPRHKKFLVAVGGNKVQMSSKNVMMLIDVDVFMQHANRKTMIPGASLIVLDQDRNTILSTDKELDLVNVLSDVYFNADREASITRENYEYNFYQSEYNGFIYIDKVPYEFKNLNTVARANLLIMGSAIASAVLLSVFLSVYLNRPVKSILKLLGGGNSKGNDFRKIYSGIVKLKTENEDFRDQAAHDETDLRRGAFLQWLDESVQSEERQWRMQRSYPEFFREKHFAMALIEFGAKEQDSRLALPAAELENAIRQGLRRENVEAQVFHTGSSQFVAVIGLKHPGERAGMIKGIEAYLERSERETWEGFALRCCVSKPYSSELENGPRAYRDMMGGRRYRSIIDADRVTDAAKIQYARTIHFPIESMEKLSNLLASGKAEESVRAIRDMMEENRQRGVSHHQFVHIAKTILFSMLRHAGDSSDAERLYDLERRVCERIESAMEYGEIERTLIEAAQVLAGLGGKEKLSKLNPAFIAQYVELHYMENMYLDHIAEVTGTTPKYFSSYFKKTFGVNYVEYLNKIRLSHAKEMLRDRSLSIAEIAEKTGYLNASTFTTTFRKYVGVSPSEYRKQYES